MTRTRHFCLVTYHTKYKGNTRYRKESALDYGSQASLVTWPYAASRINHHQKRPIIKPQTKGERRLHGTCWQVDWEEAQVGNTTYYIHKSASVHRSHPPRLSRTKTFHTSSKLLAVNSQPYSTSSSPYPHKFCQFYFSDMSLPPSDHAWLGFSHQTRSSSVGLDD